MLFFGKMKKISIVLIVLLILDVLSTIYLLLRVPGAIEMNPILSYFGNVILAVIVSHIIAIFIIYAIDLKIRNYRDKKLRNALYMMRIVGVFYVLIVGMNVYNILYSLAL